MKDTPFHYDGRSPVNQEVATDEVFVLTDEARINIAANPYQYDVTTEQE
ncbi:hypothetical protein [Halobacillus trueperi]|nr:hypothetical protein [Halobacillus trueperi]